ncbi:HTH domain resolvase [Vibrio phage 1.262.O._10N.286.51.A9]|nr:HTH domain resolvase [Vibrio phage 1.262.O._10N.286.51.A9]
MFRKNQDYFIDEIGNVTRKDGTIVKPQESPNGLGHPIVLRQNAWRLSALVHKLDNPNNYKHIVEIDGKLHWIKEETYHKMVEALVGRPNVKAPIPKHKRDFIFEQHGSMTITAIAKHLDISRMSVYRILKGA